MAFYLRYIRGTDPPEVEPFDPRRLGTMYHDALETNEWDALERWQRELCVTSTAAEDEAIKLLHYAPLARAYIPTGSQFEVELLDDQFHGFIDVLAGDTLIDIKRSNRVDHYMSSGQVGVYKRELKRISGKDVNHLYYLFIPNVAPRRYKKCKSRERDEREYEFRSRLNGLLAQNEVRLIEAPDHCGDYYEKRDEINELIRTGGEFVKNLASCARCDFRGVCEYVGKK